MKNKMKKKINCKALYLEKKRKKIKIQFGKKTIDNLNKDEILIKVSYSSINYKDILMSQGNPGLIRKYPHVAGIDATGKVLESKSNKFKKNDKVVVVAKPLGVERSGSFAEYLKIPSSWACKIPKNISEKKIIIFGTAGFSAILAINKLIENGLKKKARPILITGGTGGVGSIAVYLLSKLGFKTISSTRSKKNYNFLKKIGASHIIDHSYFEKQKNLPLLKIRYSAIIDNVGKNVISVGSKELENNGTYILIGNVDGNVAEINLLPFILRGIKLIGINAETSTNMERKKVIEKIFQLCKSDNLSKIFKEYNFKDIKKVLKKNNKINGRVIIKIS